MYNDKGYQWSGHTAAQSEQMRTSFQSTFEQLAARIGEYQLGPQLRDAIMSGAAAQDFTGDIVNLARCTLRQLEQGIT